MILGMSCNISDHAPETFIQSLSESEDVTYIQIPPGVSGCQLVSVGLDEFDKLRR